MATIFPTRIKFSSNWEDRDLPRTMITSHGSISQSAIPSDRDHGNDRVKTETVWETMNPYTTSQDIATTSISSSRRTKIAGTPSTTAKNYKNHSTAIPATSQNPGSLVAEFYESRELSDGAIAAVVLGIVFGLAAIALSVWFFICKRRRSSIINRVTSPQTPISNPSSPSSPLPTPLPPIAELSSQGERTPNMEDSWVSCGDRVRSPTPQPAVAELKSFTRTWQKPRVYTVTGGRIAELPGSKPSTSRNNDGDDDMSPISPPSQAEASRAERHVVSPMSLNSRFSTLSSRTDPGGEQEESPRGGV